MYCSLRYMLILQTSLVLSLAQRSQIVKLESVTFLIAIPDHLLLA